MLSRILAAAALACLPFVANAASLTVTDGIASDFDEIAVGQIRGGGTGTFELAVIPGGTTDTADEEDVTWTDGTAVDFEIDYDAASMMLSVSALGKTAEALLDLTGADEALMDAAREGAVTLRFYRWSPPCLSLGRNQAARGRYDRDAARERGIEVVRRPTGGRAIYHHRELTYAVTAPAGRWGGLRAAYRRINRALLRGLAGLGAAVEEAERAARAPGPSSRACFRDPLPGEIVAAGRKLVGSAQWRERSALLQHGSILLHDDQRVAEELRLDGDAPAWRAAGLSDLLEEPPSTDRLVQALRAGFREVLAAPVRDGELSRAEEERVEALEARYRGDEWTWRR